MKDLDNLSLDKKHYYSAIIWGIVILIHSFIVSRYLDSRLDRFYIIRNIDSINTNMLWVAYCSVWVVRFITCYWTVKIAKQLNREPISWGLFGIIAPGLSLIIIGFVDYKYDNNYIKTIEKKIRLEFLAETAYINNTVNADFEELEVISKKLEASYNSKLRIEAEKYLADPENYNYSSNNIEPDISNTSKNEETQPKETLLVKCPACNAKLIDKQEVCNDCGLTLI